MCVSYVPVTSRQETVTSVIYRLNTLHLDVGVAADALTHVLSNTNVP